jgi:hypothetical protein
VKGEEARRALAAVTGRVVALEQTVKQLTARVAALEAPGLAAAAFRKLGIPPEPDAYAPNGDAKPVCGHEHLNMEGICRGCGEDRRGI